MRKFVEDIAVATPVGILLGFVYVHQEEILEYADWVKGGLETGYRRLLRVVGL